MYNLFFILCRFWLMSFTATICTKSLVWVKGFEWSESDWEERENCLKTVDNLTCLKKLNFCPKEKAWWWIACWFQLWVSNLFMQLAVIKPVFLDNFEYYILKITFYLFIFLAHMDAGNNLKNSYYKIIFSHNLCLLKSSHNCAF